MSHLRSPCGCAHPQRFPFALIRGTDGDLLDARRPRLTVPDTRSYNESSNGVDRPGGSRVRPHGNVRRQAARRALVISLGAFALLATSAGGALGAGVTTATTKAPASGAVQAALATAVSPASVPGASVSAVVLEPGQAHPLAAVNAGGRLPAGIAWSLVTAATALWHLGPTATVSTAVVAPAPRSGTILGDLAIEGGGDATLTAADVAALAHAVSLRAHVITGNIVVDGTVFAFPTTPAGWSVAQAMPGVEPPAAALSVDADAITLTVSPAAKAGQAAVVRASPAGLVPVIGELPTIAAKAGRVATVSATMNASGTQIELAGSVPVGSPPTLVTVYPPDPAHVLGTLLRRDLAADGVAVQGGVAVGTPVPGSTLLAGHASAALAAWMPGLWSASAQAGGVVPEVAQAEALYRLLCRPVPTAPCGPSADARVVQRFIDAIGGGGGAGTDGSGLAAGDVASASTLAQVLAVAGLHAWGTSLLAALPPLGTVLPVAPAGATGIYAASGHDLSLVARVPPVGGTGPDRIVALLATGLPSPGAAARLAVLALDAAAQVVVHGGVGKSPVAAATVSPATADAVRAALSAAGPGSEVAGTVWPIGASAPSFNLNGDTLLPLTGTGAVFVGGAALSAASPSVSLSTRAVVDGTLSGTTVHGSIGLVGGLDPDLNAGQLATLARQVQALGVRDVTAGITVDDSALPPTSVAAWPWQTAGTAPTIAGDALTVGDGLYSLAVLPGRRIGQAPTIEVVPAATPVQVTNEARTVSGTGQTLAVWPQPGTSHLVVTGTIGVNQRLGAVFLRAAPDPALMAGILFQADLRADGVRVGSAVRRAPIPAVAPALASVPGESLSAMVSGLLAAPGPTTAWDVAAMLGGALHGVPGAGAVAIALGRAATDLRRLGSGAPPPTLGDPLGIGTDDLAATYGCARTLARWAAARGATAQVPALLPLVPTAGRAVTVRAVEGNAASQGSSVGYVIAAGRPVAAFCLAATGLERNPAPVLSRAVASVASFATPPAHA